MVDIGGFADKAKDFAGQHPDQVQQGIDKAGDTVDERTGGQHAEHVDTAQEKAGDFLTGGQDEGGEQQ
ncbi:antitoxin [Kocuria sp. LUK]|uniref:Antitoxin n=1 Tax=Kocuria flava TaxID=446860 RepID=A0A2N4SZJ4_9MICC|nr:MULTISPECIES: antitoxin [Kocuria]MCD1144481.1 antitoxin [Kocuria sp. LUK]PLC11404.1 hypothetical protein AUQ48_02965 [Kocuria flava]